MERRRHKLKKFIGLLMALVVSASFLAACGGGGEDAGDKNFGDAPIISIGSLDKYIEIGKPINLLSYVQNLDFEKDDKANLEVKLFRVRGTEKTEDTLKAGYDAETYTFTPQQRRGDEPKEMEIRLIATNKVGQRVGFTTVIPTLPSQVRVVSPFNKVVQIGDKIDLKQGFVLNEFINAEATASVTYSEDGEVKVEDTSVNVTSSTGIYEIKQHGTHHVNVKLHTGLNIVEKSFEFEAQRQGTVIMIEWMDDLMGAAETDDGSFEGGGIVQDNPRLNYRLKQSLDSNNPAHWKDGKVKPFNPIQQEANGKTNPFTGSIDGGGNTLTLSNKFLGVDGQEAFTTLSLQSLFNSSNGSGTITNLNVVFNYEITDKDFAEEKYRLPNSIAALNSSQGALKLENVTVSGKINIDFTNHVDQNRANYTVSGVSTYAASLNNVHSKVDISLLNIKKDAIVKVSGGVRTLSDGGQFTNSTYEGTLKATIAENQQVRDLEVSGFFNMASGTSSVVDNLETKGNIEVLTEKGNIGLFGIKIAGIGMSASNIANSKSSINVHFDKLHHNGSSSISGIITSLGNGDFKYNKYTGTITVDDLDFIPGSNGEIQGYIAGLIGSHSTSFNAEYNTFSGIIIAKGSGHKQVGGMIGKLSGYMTTVKNNAIKGSFELGDGVQVFGGIIANYAGGAANRASVISENVYTGKLVHGETLTEKSADNGSNSALGGIIGNFTAKAGKNLVEISQNEVYGSLGNSTLRAIIIGRLAEPLSLFGTLNTGKMSAQTSAAYNSDYTIVYYKLTKTDLDIATSSEILASPIVITDNLHDKAEYEGVKTINISGLQDLASSAIEAYNTNIMKDYVDLSIESTEGWDSGMLVTVEGKTYLRITDRDYKYKADPDTGNMAYDSEVRYESYEVQCKTKANTAEREASKEIFSQRVQKIIQELTLLAETV